jgi:hypothetical protein
MWRVVVTARLKHGARERVSEILRQGPPYDLADTALERHGVFLGPDEVVFIFEGPRADEEVRRLIARSAVADRASRLASCFAGSPRVSEEVFGWEREAPVEGVSFAPYPGPGDSDGG